MFSLRVGKPAAGYCAANAPDWSGDRSSQWPGRHPQVRFGLNAKVVVFFLKGLHFVCSGFLGFLVCYSAFLWVF